MKNFKEPILTTLCLLSGLSASFGHSEGFIRTVSCQGPAVVQHCHDHPMTVNLQFSYGNVLPLYHDGELRGTGCGWPPYTTISLDFAKQVGSNIPGQELADQNYDLYREDGTTTADRAVYLKYGSLVLTPDKLGKIVSGIYTGNDGQVMDLTCKDED